MKYLLFVCGLPGSGKSSIIRPMDEPPKGFYFVPAIRSLMPMVKPDFVKMLNDPKLSDIAAALSASGKNQAVFCTSPNFCIPSQVEKTLELVKSMGVPIAARVLFITPDLEQSALNLKTRALGGGNIVAEKTLEHFNLQYDIPKLKRIFKKANPKTQFNELPTFTMPWPEQSPAAQLTQHVVSSSGLAVEALAAMPEWPKTDPTHAELFFVHETYITREAHRCIDGRYDENCYKPPAEFNSFPKLSKVAKALAPDVTLDHIRQIKDMHVKELQFSSDDYYSNYDYCSKYLDVRNVAAWLVAHEYKVNALEPIYTASLIEPVEKEIDFEVELG